MYSVMAERWDGQVQKIVDCGSRREAVCRMREFVREFRLSSHYSRWWLVRSEHPAPAIYAD